MSELQQAIKRARAIKFPVAELSRPEPAKSMDERSKELITILRKAPAFFSNGYPSIAAIKRVVAERYGITETDLVSARKTLRLALPRQIVMYLCRKLTPRSLVHIGRHIGDRDHTTVLHGARKIKQLRATNPSFDSSLREIETALTMVNDTK